MVWNIPTGEGRVHEAAPVVNNGVMFITTPNNQVIALNAKTGEELWRYRRPRPAGAFVLHDTNRGVALYGDKVYYAAGEAVLVALDAKTGKEVWTTTVADNKAAYYLTLAPLVANNKVMIGASGGEFGVRGFVAAFDPDTGKQLWKTHMVPAPGEPGSETWPKGDQWKTGGAPGVGDRQLRSRDQSLVLGNRQRRPVDGRPAAGRQPLRRIDGGHRRGHRTDQGALPVQPERVLGLGRSLATAAHRLSAQRTHDQGTRQRRARRLSVVPRAHVRHDQVRRGQAYVTQNVFRGLDPKTGKPDVDPAHKPGTGKRAEFCPGSHGGKNWPPIAFSPQTRMIYIPANNNLCGALMGVPVTYERGKGFAGTQFGGPGFAAPGADHVGGEVQAWNVDTGQRVWRHSIRVQPELGLDARHGRWCRVQRRHQRPQGSRVRRGHAASSSGSS